MEDMMPKVETLRQMHPGLDIAVDGGVGPATIDSAAKVSSINFNASLIYLLLLVATGIIPLLQTHHRLSGRYPD